ncbi:hypothetical protein WN48_00498 [Eufriesea mexicana]|uniref:uncharacterized protein LOC108555277 n=1 Tax=Eufriesea mexicana TaxID=516756 RepID=UPI00083BC415|nr:PREDICTED: uncharacterized protein LOC108555277 [Eufriesea mexicana]OAD61179.1 hypothetical protein WN48_00498 [Eufriesea mexicana]
MMELETLKDAVECLKNSTYSFPVGAISIDDFKPIEEKIKSKRESLKRLNSKLLTLKAHHNYQVTNNSEELEEDVRIIVTKLNEATANTLLTNEAIKLCLHSDSIHAILTGKEGDHNMQKKIYACMRKLFCFNDCVLSIQNEIEEALKKQLELKIQCQNAIYDYKNFLNEQEKLRNKILEETNPQMAQYKEKTYKTLENINLSKRLIVDFIAASHNMLLKNPLFIEMLEEHRELISIETILKISKSMAEDK